MASWFGLVFFASSLCRCQRVDWYEIWNGAIYEVSFSLKTHADAVSDAQQKTMLNGDLHGLLVQPQSSAEDTEICSYSSSVFWMGASDSGGGTWSYDGGSLDGDSFAVNDVAVPGYYVDDDLFQGLIRPNPGCLDVPEDETAELICGTDVIEILFASYGNPSGCSTGSCYSTPTRALVRHFCNNKHSCSFYVDNNQFGDPGCNSLHINIEFQCVPDVIPCQAHFMSRNNFNRDNVGEWVLSYATQNTIVGQASIAEYNTLNDDGGQDNKMSSFLVDIGCRFYFGEKPNDGIGNEKFSAEAGEYLQDQGDFGGYNDKLSNVVLEFVGISEADRGTVLGSGECVSIDCAGGHSWTANDCSSLRPSIIRYDYSGIDKYETLEDIFPWNANQASSIGYKGIFNTNYRGHRMQCLYYDSDFGLSAAYTRKRILTISFELSSRPNCCYGVLNNFQMRYKFVSDSVTELSAFDNSAMNVVFGDDGIDLDLDDFYDNAMYHLDIPNGIEVKYARNLLVEFSHVNDAINSFWSGTFGHVVGVPRTNGCVVDYSNSWYATTTWPYQETNEEVLDKVAMVKFLVIEGGCPLGEYSGTDGQCRSCDAGRYGVAKDLEDKSCSGPCSEGYYCPAGSATPDAVLCPPTVSCPSGSQTPNSLCSPGYYCPGGGVGPQPCDVGTYQEMDGSFDCEECPLGKFADTPGSELCENCPPGTSTTDRGATDISECIETKILPLTLKIVNGAQPSGHIDIPNMSGGIQVEFQAKIANIMDFDRITFGHPNAVIDYLCLNESYVEANQIYTFTCNIGAGVGKDLVFAMNFIISQQAVGEETMSYPAPIIHPGTLRRGPGPPTGATFLDALSSLDEELRFDGQNFGDEPDKVDIWYAYPTFQCTDIQLLHPNAVNDTVVFRTAPYGVGTGLRFTMSVGGNYANGTDELNYPQVAKIDQISGCPNDGVEDTTACPTKGRITLYLTGSSFSNNMAVTVTGKLCTNLIRIDSKSATCTLPSGTGFSQFVVASYNSQFSNPVPWVSFARPEINQIIGCVQNGNASLIDCNRDGGQQITLVGTNFGEAGASVFVGGRKATTHHDPDTPHEILYADLPAQAGMDKFVFVLQNQGEISEVLISVSYEQCEAGTFINDTNCPPCPNGQYSIVSGRQECSLCERGHFANATGSTSCEPCDLGWAINEPGQSACVECTPGKYTNETGSQACVPCDVGKYAPGNGTTSCIDCDYGMAQKNTGADSCQACRRGEYSNTEGLAKCKLCDIGRYSDHSNATSCTLCGNGTIQKDPGTSTCVDCDIGTYSKDNECVVCLPGTFSNTTKASGCEPCGSGTHSDREAASNCSECVPGKFGTGTGNAICSPCPPGRFSDDFRSTECQPCGNGTHAEIEDQSQCKECGPGRYSFGEGNVVCTPCPPGTFSDTNRTVECEPCAPGTRSESDGQTFCPPCGEGRYSFGEGNVACTLCPSGTFSDASKTVECQPCAPGTRSESDGQTFCPPCGTGTYSLGEGNVVCTLCPSGKFSDTNTTVECQPCAPGTRSESDGQTFCSPCGEGTFALGTNNKVCVDCTPGRFQNETQQEFCHGCPSGKAQIETRMSSCVPCLPGQSSFEGKDSCYKCSAGAYQDQGGQPECKPCGPGEFSTVDPQSDFGALHCEQCKPGQATNLTLQTFCAICPPGKYSPVERSPTCINCEPGRFADREAYTACKLCEPGYFSSEEESISCELCEKGSNASQPGSTECELCPVNSYANDKGTAECILCTNGEFQYDEGSLQCESCLIGQYLLFDDGVPSCIPCVQGANCTGSEMFAHEDFWLMKRPDGRVRSFLCDPGHCKSGLECNRTEIREEHDDLIMCCSANREYAHTNVLCGKCATGFYEWGDQCIDCSGSNGGIIAALLVVTWIYVLLFHKIIQQPDASTAIFLYFVQILVVLLAQAIWAQWMEIFSFNAFMGTGSVCLGKFSPILKLWINALLPFICAAILGLTMLIQFLVFFAKYRLTERDPTKSFKKAPYIRTFFALFLFSYNSVTTTVFKFLYCVDISEDISILAADPAIHCTSREYDDIFPIVIVFLIVITVGGPFFLLYGLYRLKTRGDLYSDKYLSRYGVLYEDYRNDRYWWGFVVLARRAVVVGVFVALSIEGPAVQYMGVSVVQLAVLISHIAMKPFMDEEYKDNMTESISLVVLLVVSVILTAARVPLGIEMSIVLAILIFGSITAFICLVVSRYCKNVKGIYKDEKRFYQAKQKRKETSYSSGITNKIDDGPAPSPLSESARGPHSNQSTLFSNMSGGSHMTGMSGISETQMTNMSDMNSTHMSKNTVMPPARDKHDASIDV